MRYFNYKVKTKMNTPKNYFTAVASLLYTSSVPKGEYQHYLKTLLYKQFFVVLRVKLQLLNRKREFQNKKRDTIKSRS